MAWCWRPITFMAWTHAATRLLAWAVMLGLVAYVVWPTFRDLKSLGIHDWDTMESYRYLVVKTIERYHQFPFWNPYSCGGHPVWGWVEGDATIISPFFPVYMLLSFPLALRIEVAMSAVISVVGAWLLAGRFTRSPATRALVGVLFAVNGRWALQVASGHAWHLTYAWTPWVLYFVDRAFADSLRAKSPARNVIGASVALAMMVYDDGIYPLPQTLIIVALYAVFYAVTIRDCRPLLCAGAVGVVTFGLSAPKLLPMLAVMARFPRYTDSPEAMDLGLFIAILTSRDQDFGSLPVGTPRWGWHEWGMYIGTAGVACLLVGLIAGRGERAGALKWTAVILIALGFGSVHEWAPWTLLHRLPIFKSQHVPSRWLYPGVLVSAVVAATVVERAMTRAGFMRPWLEMAAMAAVAAIAYDIGPVARLPMVHAFEREPPRARESLGDFHTELHLPGSLNYSTAEWSPPSLPAEMANIGTIDCGTFAGLNNWGRDHNNHTPGLGARGRGDPAYQGEAYMIEKVGRASIVRWTPNEVVVRVEGARVGDHVALNQNYDSGWTANGRSALDWADIVAAPVATPAQTVVFRYRPSTWWLALATFAMSIGAIGFFSWRRTRERLHGPARRRPR
ncbi:MAG: hypothetical protein ABSF69_03270 [Polyangiaceae bacterium]|jgi:hypothetical protein